MIYDLLRMIMMFSLFTKNDYPLWIKLCSKRHYFVHVKSVYHSFFDLTLKVEKLENCSFFVFFFVFCFFKREFRLKL